MPERFYRSCSEKSIWWLLPDSNWGHAALQAAALPTELKSHNPVILRESASYDKLLSFLGESVFVSISEFLDGFLQRALEINAFAVG